MTFAKRYFIFFFLVIGLGAEAQRYNDDAALWLSLNFDKKLNDNFGLQFSQQNRLGENMSQYIMGYGDLGLVYNYNKNIKATLDYVYGKSRRLDGTYKNRQMFYFALILKKKFGQWTLLYRNRVQLQTQELQADDYGVQPSYYERNKLVLKYEINKRFEAYVSEELYLPFYQATGKGVDRSRSGLGLIYTLDKKNSLEFYFLYQHELNAYKRAKRLFVYGIAFNHEF